jgi:hypothetical protein
MKWVNPFNTSEAVKVGTALADHFLTALSKPEARRKATTGKQDEKALQILLERIDREAGPLQLGLLRRAKLANTFKWRLLDKGVAPAVADELTRILLLRLSRWQPDPSRNLPSSR